MHHLPPPPPLTDPPITFLAPPQLLGENSLSPPSAAPPALALQRSPSTIALPPFSPRNPFFGYPAIASATSPHTVRHVRKGLRELVRTLAVLWWRRWGRWVWTWAGVCAVMVTLVQRMRHARVWAGIRTGMTVKELVNATVDATRARR